MDDKDIINEEKKRHTKLFPKKEYVIERGKGALLYDTQGNEYIDCVGGHAVMNIGHSHPKFIKAVNEQVEKLVMVSPGTPVEARAQLLEKLTSILPSSLNQAFLTNSGTEAVESALKLSLACKRDIKKPEVIVFKKDFHGRTLGSLAMTFNRHYREAFMPWLSPHVKWASFGKIDSVKELVNENTAAIFMELVQGEGGVYPAPQEFPKEIRELCNEKDISRR